MQITFYSSCDIGTIRVVNVTLCKANLNYSELVMNGNDRQYIYNQLIKKEFITKVKRKMTYTLISQLTVRFAHHCRTYI